MQNLQTDVLVIGGGGAAARAAWEAHQAGARVMLATKGAFGAIGTRGAGATASGFSAAGAFATPGWTGEISPMEKRYAGMVFSPPDQAYEKIIQVGLGMASPNLVRILIEDAVATRQVLLELGATFAESGLRSHGVPIMAALVSHIKRSEIVVHDRTMISDLLVRDGECVGAVGVHELTGETCAIQAQAVILGAGGDADLFMLNLNPPGNSGDSYTLGYNAGADLINLEFKQIFLGTIYPTRNMLTGALPPGSRFLNAHQEEFLSRYLPPGATVEDCLAQRNGHNPFTTRDALSRYVEISIVSEVKAGRGTKYNGVFLDWTGLPAPAVTGLAGEYWSYKGLDFTQAFHAGVNHHCSLGGLKIDANAETTVAHLYAAGEAAAGPHGADRMGGHMLLASQVFGARAARHAAAYALKHQPVPLEPQIWQAAESRIEELRVSRGDRNPAELKRTLQKLAYFDLLVIRREKALSGFLGEVTHLDNLARKLDVVNSPDLIEALELQNLLLLARLEAEIFRLRKESRGPHYREDFPFQDDENWVKCITVKQVDGQPQYGYFVPDTDWKTQGDKKIGFWA